MHRKLTNMGLLYPRGTNLQERESSFQGMNCRALSRAFTHSQLRVENCTMLPFMAVNDACLHRSAFNDFDSWFSGTLLRRLRMLCELSDRPPGNVTRNQRVTSVTLPPTTYGD